KRVATGTEKIAGGVLAGEPVTGTLDGLKDVAPKAMRDVMKAAQMAGSGQYKDDRGYKVLDVTAGDVIGKAIGFQPGAVAAVQEADSAARQMVSLVRTRESEIAQKWAQGIAEKDPGNQQQARRELADWNEKNPE